MTSMKLFIIPWLLIASTVTAQNAAASGPAVPAPNAQFVDIPFYQFLQRQNQINNAILLNNAMLANSLGAVPKEHHIRLPNTMPFPAANLPTGPALFQNFPQPIPPVPPATGIYDVLSHGLRVNPVLVPTPSPPTQRTTVSTTTSTAAPPRPAVKSEENGPVASEERHRGERKKVIDRSAELDKQIAASTSRTSSFRQLEEEIRDDTYGTTTTEKAREQTTTAKPHEDVYKLLRTLNLTDEETDDIVSHVEKVVREEVVKKLAETRLHALNNSAQASNKTAKTWQTSTNISVEATTVPVDTEARVHVETPLIHTKTDKELLLYLPRKKPEAEIKHHPQRIDDKATEDKREIGEAEILTAQMHLPIEERLVDDKSDDDFNDPGSEESAKVEETIRTTTTETTATTSKLSTLPPMVGPPPALHIRDGVNGTVIAEGTTTERKSYGGIDADLLGIGLATGAPLDLEMEGSRVVPYRTRNVPRASSTETPPPPVFQKQTHVRAKGITKPKTAFERLAVDYKERLTGAGDMNKILKSLYSNAYIALVDAKEAPNVRLPLNIRRAELQYTQRLH